MRILVVDDSGTMRALTRKVLKDLGYDAIELASSASDALSLLGKRKYDLAFFDWHMPQMSGLDLLKKVRENEATRDLPVIMLTVEQQKSNVALAVESGADAYILKPLRADVLGAKLGQIAAKRGFQSPGKPDTSPKPEAPKTDVSAVRPEPPEITKEQQDKAESLAGFGEETPDV